MTKNYKELTKGSKSSISSFINIVMELKKCCNHAFLVRSLETSDTLNKSQFEVITHISINLVNYLSYNMKQIMKDVFKEIIMHLFTVCVSNLEFFCEEDICYSESTNYFFVCI